MKATESSARRTLSEPDSLSQEDEFWIIGITGLQNVTVDFCGCGKGDQ
jgi:hypothetical protein